GRLMEMSCMGLAVAGVQPAVDKNYRVFYCSALAEKAHTSRGAMPGRPAANPRPGTSVRQAAKGQRRREGRRCCVARGETYAISALGSSFLGAFTRSSRFTPSHMAMEAATKTEE